jgi:hypothetical protein
MPGISNRNVNFANFYNQLKIRVKVLSPFVKQGPGVGSEYGVNVESNMSISVSEMSSVPRFLMWSTCLRTMQSLFLNDNCPVSCLVARDRFYGSFFYENFIIDCKMSFFRMHVAVVFCLIFFLKLSWWCLALPNSVTKFNHDRNNFLFIGI